MEAQGRGPDRTLVHMTPKEVQGLQAIAMAHGGSLTINPVTGLPEAGFLDSLLPAIAGFALNAFAPGVGTAVGGMFGLGGAAGTALAIGGISGLASGNLEKGIMAGLGAYGGAALGDSAGYGAGAAKTAQEANNVAAGLAVAEEQNAAALGSKAAGQSQVGGGIAAAANAPKDFLKDNKYALAALAAPALLGSQGKEPAALPSSGYIRTMKRDPVTGEIYQESATPTGEFGNRSVGTYGGVARMADGGDVSEALADTNPDAFKQVAYDTRTDSQKALDYLMGKPGAVNPMLFSSRSSGAPLLPLDYRTRTGGKYILNAATNTYDWVPDASSPTSGLPALNTGQGGGGGDYNNYVNPNVAKETFEEQSARNQILNDNLTNLSKVSLTGMLMSGINSIFGPPNNYAPVEYAGTALANSIVEGRNADVEANSRDALPGAIDSTWGGGLEGTLGDQPGDYDGQGGAPGVAGSNDTTAAADNSGNTSSDPGGSSGDGTGGEARGGLNANGRYYPPRYAQGGIAALAQGGITGSGNLDLSIPLDIGGGSMGGASGVGGGSYPFTSIGGQGSNQQQTFGSSNNPQPFIGNNNARSMMPQQGVTFLPDPTLDPKIRQFPTDMESVRQSMMKTRGLPPNVMFAGGGIANLGDYSDGGRLLRGPGDGVSDSIPATIGKKRPARLADGEFVVPARIVSELGNGSTEAGARKLYAMMDRIQAGRKKTMGKTKTAVNSKAVRHLPA